MGLVAVSVHADAGVGKVDYVRDVKPLFEKRCGACHGALKQKAGLRLDAGVLVMKGSEEGAVIKPGDVRGSLLITKVTATDIEDRMPPEGEGEALTDEQVDLLRRWITQGAVRRRTVAKVDSIGLVVLRCGQLSLGLRSI